MPEHPPTPTTISVGALLDGVKVIFSWMILMPIAVIVSGRMLAQRFKLAGGSQQLFEIPIKGVLVIGAKNDEVTLGFAGFFFTLFLVALAGGKNIYDLVKSHFGIDPGHFNSLCIFSSFATVVWSTIWFVLSKQISPLKPLREEHERLIKDIVEKGKK